MNSFTKFLKFELAIIGLLLLQVSSCKKDEEIVIKDADGNVYTSIQIGTQVWLVENLKSTMYSNGDLIGTTSLLNKDISGEGDPKYQWAYSDNEINVPAYGRLYTWYTATDSRNICPKDWHVPTDDEWTTLTNYLGGGYIAGGKLKETGRAHWKSPNVEANNESGFTAIPAGFRESKGEFSHKGSYGFWWSLTVEDTSRNAVIRRLDYDFSYIFRLWDSKKNGYSVRCIKD